jgi:20S proteasome alpha/beta subunit
LANLVVEPFSNTFDVFSDGRFRLGPAWEGVENRLVAPFQKPKYLVKTNRKPVTLIVGIICTDGIVIAGDSQTSWGAAKSWDAQKITDLEHANGHAIIAESGAVITSSNIVEELAKQVPEKQLFEKYGLPGLVKMAVLKVREELRRQHFSCTSEELQNVIERNELDATLMVAHYEKDTPRIETIKFTVGITNRSKSFFEVVGSGSDLAHYLLSNLCLPGMEMDCAEATIMAVHVVETVKRHDPYCGGPTRVGVLRHPKHIKTGEVLVIKDKDGSSVSDDSLPVFIPSQKAVGRIVSTAYAAETATKYQRWSIIIQALTQDLKAQTTLLRNAAKSIEKEFGKKMKRRISD